MRWRGLALDDLPTRHTDASDIQAHGVHVLAIGLQQDYAAGDPKRWGQGHRRQRDARQRIRCFDDGRCRRQHGAKVFQTCRAWQWCAPAVGQFDQTIGLHIVSHR